MKYSPSQSLFVLFLLIITTSCSPKKEVDTSVQGPNIIYILSDDQSWTDFGFMGHESIETPNLDRLASEGLTFTRGYAAAPYCRPSLASIATGLYPHQHGVIGNDPAFTFEEGEKFDTEWMTERARLDKPIVDAFKELPTLADILGEKGYISLQTGKWWEGHYSSGGFTSGMTTGDPARGGRHGDAGLSIGREGLEPIFNFIDRALEEEKPFFIWYAPLMPHEPHNPPDSLLNKYLALTPSESYAHYWAMCEWFDITCGQLTDYVEDKGLSENTMIVFVTDNGWIPDPERINRRLRRSKGSPYEMGIRTPIMFRWKGHIEPRMDTVNFVNSIDIATTILEVCGSSATEEMQGINVLKSEILIERKAIFAESWAHNYRLKGSLPKHRVVLSRPWKLIVPDTDLPNAVVELYNIIEDPHELYNRAADHPELVADLYSHIEIWWRSSIPQD